MELEGKITEPDLNDVRKLMRSRLHWFKLLVSSWHGFALLAGIIWATALGLMGRTKPNWRAMEVIWLVAFAIFVWSFYRAKIQTVREFNELNAELPERIRIVNEGIKLDGPNEATASLPWKAFKAWREGRTVFLLERSEGGFLILPTRNFSEAQRQALRGLLNSHFPAERTIR